MTFKLIPACWTVAAATLLTTSSWGALTVNSSTELWTPVLYGPGNIPDATSDQQTGSLEGDIVGNTNHPSLYTAFFDGGTPDIYTDGEIAFRFRVAGDKSPSGFNGCAFVGMDLDGNGSLDIFAGVNNSGSHDEVGLWWAGANAISPNSTTLAKTPSVSYEQTSANYSRAVDGSLEFVGSGFFAGSCQRRNCRVGSGNFHAGASGNRRRNPGGPAKRWFSCERKELKRRRH